uniref:2OG-FeII_Oxy_2 domain-containing protein n=1 Tax=Trichobilharzia regenti TaxID=157069 RepID=A0AA85IPZ2_TRIRE|nr:unnamed protein product [Trichobilharzia regenti]
MSFALHRVTFLLRRKFQLYPCSKWFSIIGTKSLTNTFCSDHDLAKIVSNDLVLKENFITEEEESNLIAELDSVLLRRKYQTEHWDYAIKDFRELERRNWKPVNQPVIRRLKTLTVDSLSNNKTNITDSIDQLVLPLVHVLDLAESGEIMPHVDSVKFCGDSVTVLSLLSDCILRLAIAPQSDVVGIPENQWDYLHSLTLPSIGTWIDVFIPRRSVYVMRRALRYLCTHAILSNGEVGRMHQQHESVGLYSSSPRGRRVSVICRTHANDGLIPFYNNNNDNNSNTTINNNPVGVDEQSSLKNINF